MRLNKKIQSLLQKMPAKLNYNFADFNFAKNENAAKLAYKVLHDTFCLLLITYFCLLFAESVLPGLIARFFSILQMTLLLAANLLVIAYLGEKYNFTALDTDHIKKSALIFALVTAVFLLLGNSMLKFSLWQNLIITAATILIFFYLKRILLDGKN